MAQSKNKNNKPKKSLKEKRLEKHQKEAAKNSTDVQSATK